MNYNKIEYLRKEKKVSLPEFSASIGMSKSGFEKMMREKTCKVSTLEAIADYFSKPILYFFDDRQDVKAYYENEAITAALDVPPVTYGTTDKDIIIQKQDGFIQQLQETIKALIEKIGGDGPQNGSSGNNTPHVPHVRGFKSIHDPKFQMFLRTLISEVQHK